MIQERVVLPDFVRVKGRTERQLLRWLEEQIPELTPLVKGVQRFRQHEGRLGRIVRSDESEGVLNYPKAEFQLEVSREDIRSGDIGRIRPKCSTLRSGSESTSEGNAESRRRGCRRSWKRGERRWGELTKEHLLELFRRVHMDFDPNTLKPLPGAVFVMHPDMAAKIVPKAKAWEQDPAFNAEYERIMQQKREEWRAREANRKLVS